MGDSFFIDGIEFIIEDAEEVQDIIDAFFTMAQLNDKQISLSQRHTRTMISIDNHVEKYEFVLFISPVSKKISFGWLDLKSSITGFNCLCEIGGEKGTVTKYDLKRIVDLLYRAI
ncbi:hypothetical protein D3C87_78350 [compost metagenome]